MRRNPIVGLDVFLTVAKHGTLHVAANELGIRPSAISQQLKALEQRLGVSLFTRTTRSIRLTDAGEHLLARVEPAMTELLESLEEIQAFAEEPSGLLRITVPEVALQMTLQPFLLEFRKAYPKITLELSIDDGFVDIVAEGFHAGVRSAHQLHDDMIAVRLTPPLRDAFFASPDYIATHGRPETPGDLIKHDCIVYRYIASKRLGQWSFKQGEKEINVRVRGSLIVNDTALLIDAARAGLGIASFYRVAVEGYVASGELEFLLEEQCTEYPGFFLYFPKNLQKLRRLRALIDFFTAVRQV